MNSINPNLVTQHLAEGLITTATNRLAALRLFSRDFGAAPMAPRKVVQVRKATAGSATQTNPTNFETGDTTLDNIEVTVNQVSKSFHITNEELNSGFRLKDLAAKNAQIFTNAISDVWTALVTSGNFGSPEVIGPAANFDSGVLAGLYGMAKDYSAKHLVLDGSYAGRLISAVNPLAFQSAPQDGRGAFGFQAVAEQNRWTAAETNAVGLLCSPDTIALASGLPASMPPGEFEVLARILLPDVGLTVLSAVWFSRASRSWWASYDVMFGAGPGDTTQAKILTSA